MLLHDLRRAPVAYAVHPYHSGRGVPWGSFLKSIWRECRYRISAAATELADDHRDSLIGPQLYWRQVDRSCGVCAGTEGEAPREQSQCKGRHEAMLSEVSAARLGKLSERGGAEDTRF